MGLQSVLNIGKESIAHAQTALQTIGHNISNAGVDGYSRQEVIATTNAPFERSYGFLGTGVRIETIRSIVDKFLNTQILRVKSDLSSLSAQSGGIRLVETFLKEGSGEGGLNSALDQFFMAAEDLAAKPEGAAERTGFINAAANLVREVTSLAKAVEDIQIESDRDIV